MAGGAGPTAALPPTWIRVRVRVRLTARVRARAEVRARVSSATHHRCCLFAPRGGTLSAHVVTAVKAALQVEGVDGARLRRHLG